MKKIAIIGAGLAGLTLANKLQPYAEITLFEKARGVGGRLATRRAPPYEFDFGAQYFTVHDASFQQLVDELIAANVVERWDANFAEITNTSPPRLTRWNTSPAHYVGVPSMNAIAKYLAASHNIKLTTCVSRIEKVNRIWKLISDQEVDLGYFDWVICTAPAKQTQALMPLSFKYHNILQDINMQACFALMLGFRSAPPLLWEAAIIKNSIISWISVNSSKPQRQAHSAWVALSSNAWADEHIEVDTAAIAASMLDEILQLTKVERQQIDCIDLHRWRYANTPKIELNEPLIDSAEQLAACGDWCISGRVESSYVAATQLAVQIIHALKQHS
jgi:renalase